MYSELPNPITSTSIPLLLHFYLFLRPHGHSPFHHMSTIPWRGRVKCGKGGWWRGLREAVTVTIITCV